LEIFRFDNFTLSYTFNLVMLILAPFAFATDDVSEWPKITASLRFCPK